MYTMKLSFPNLDKGAEVDIDGLGRFQNGYSYEITTEEADAFRVSQQSISYQTDSLGTPVVKIQKGPTLGQAFKKHKYINVTALKSESELNVEDDDNVEGGDK